MKRLIPLIFLLFLTVTLSAQSHEAADRYADLFEEQKWGELIRNADRNLQRNFSKRKFKTMWNQLEVLMGDYKHRDSGSFADKDGALVATYILHFEQSSLELFLRLNEKQEIAGLNFFMLNYQAPEKFNGKAISVERLSLKTDGLELPGEIVLPDTCSNCPIVILVHGSGPADMDESMGPNKVFKDIALELSSRGIATYRYDKRSKVYPQYFDDKDSGNLDLSDYVLDDALQAIEMIRGHEIFDSSNVYLLGHSLGGSLAPMIAALSPELSGIVMMGGPLDSLHNLIRYQYKFLSEEDGEISFGEKMLQKKADKAVSMVDQGVYKTKYLNYIGAWGEDFWREIMAYNPVDTLNAISTPAMLCYGSRDYQVPPSRDSVYWGSVVGLSETEDQRLLKVYDGLNHLFMYGTGNPNRGEYFNPAHVSEEFLDDVAAWIYRLEG